MDTPTVPFSTPQDPYGKGRPPFHSAREPQRWWEKTWVILLACVVLPPVGIALIWIAAKKWNSSTKKLATGVTAAWLVLFLAIGVTSEEPSEETVVPSEKEAVKVDKEITTQPITTSTTSTTSTTTSTTRRTTTTRASDIYYKSCAQVRAAGKAPLYRGDPGYRPGLDRDNDGVACEV